MGFEGWENEAGEIISTSKHYEFELEEDKQLVAQFRDLKEDGTIIEKHDDIDWSDWSTDEVLELSKEAFSVYFDIVRPNLFASNAEQKLQQGDLILNYPGVRDYEIEIEEIIKFEDRVEVEALISFPHADDEKFEKLEEDIEEEILAEINEEPVDLHEVFFDVLEEAELSVESTMKTLTLEAHYIEDKEEVALRVVDIDLPETLFASFHELYQQAVAHHVEDVVVEISEDETADPSVEKTAEAKLFDEETTVTPAIDPYYLADQTTFTFIDEVDISLTTVWDQLTENVDYNPHLGFGPEAYFNQIQFSDTSQEGKQPILFTRPYAVATMDSVIGYFDKETEEINLFTEISSGDVSDFYWSPDGKYISYYFSQAGSGFVFLHVYDIESDEVIEVSEFEAFKEIYGIEQERGGFIGEFKDFSWSDDSETLYFDAIPRDEAEFPEDHEATSWVFDVQEQALILDDD